MSDQVREAFEQKMKQGSGDGALLMRRCHYNAEDDAYYENKYPDCMDVDVTERYAAFKSGYQAGQSDLPQQLQAAQELNRALSAQLEGNDGKLLR